MTNPPTRPIPLVETSVMGLTGQLGDYFEREPVEQSRPVSMPRRANPNAWPAHIAAEMQAIYATPDPFATPIFPDDTGRSDR